MMRDSNLDIIARGESPAVTIDPSRNEPIETKVVIKALIDPITFKPL
jgi:hypothetical protein